MMTQQIGFSVLAAPLAAIDRRALSQAWYSALHLEQESSALPVAPTMRGAATNVSSAPAKFEQLQGERAANSPPRQLRATRESVAPRAEALSDRRAVRSPLARRIEREFLRPAEPPRRATFSIEGTGARVHVTMQGSGLSLRLIAVCPPRVRATVARALDEARFALARRGIALALVLEEVNLCK